MNPCEWPHLVGVQIHMCHLRPGPCPVGRVVAHSVSRLAGTLPRSLTFSVLGCFALSVPGPGGSQIMPLNYHKEMGAENTPAKNLMVEGELDNAKQ